MVSEFKSTEKVNSIQKHSHLIVIFFLFAYYSKAVTRGVDSCVNGPPVFAQNSLPLVFSTDIEVNVKTFFK